MYLSWGRGWHICAKPGFDSHECELSRVNNTYVNSNTKVFLPKCHFQEGVKMSECVQKVIRRGSCSTVQNGEVLGSTLSTLKTRTKAGSSEQRALGFIGWTLQATRSQSFGLV